jgi:hypothetical protein
MATTIAQVFVDVLVGYGVRRVPGVAGDSLIGRLSGRRELVRHSDAAGGRACRAREVR